MGVSDSTSTGRRAWKVAYRALLAVTALLVVDGLAGLIYHRSAQASVVITRPAGAVDEALVVFPGYAGDGKVISEAFAPHLLTRQALIVVDYAERGIDDQAVFRLVADGLAQLAPQRVRVLGGSMGGIAATRFVTKYVNENPHPGNLVLVLDTAPSGARTIHRPKWMFWLSSWYRGGPITSAGWAVVSYLGDRPPAEEDADPALVRAGESSFAWIGTPALTSQAAYIATFDPSEIAKLETSAVQVTYLQADEPQNDPLVDVRASIADWQARLPCLTVATIRTRHGSWHLPWTYRPRETLDAINAA